MKADAILEKLNNLQQILQQDEKPLSFIEACNYLDVSKSHCYKLTHKGLISHFKPNGKKLYFLKSDLNKYMLRHRRKAENEIDQEANDYVFNGEVISGNN